jgi:hypothetical protein
MIRKVKKRFDIIISEEGKSNSKTFELEKNITKVAGLLFTSDKDDLLYFRGSQRVELNGREYFPDSYESKLLMCGVNVPPAKRYYPLECGMPGNGLIKVEFVDTPDGRTSFEEYRVSLYLDCEIEDELS